MGEFVTYTTWSGSPVVHLHLPSGELAYLRGKRWVVPSVLYPPTFRDEGEALRALISTHGQQMDRTETTLLSLSSWAERNTHG